MNKLLAAVTVLAVSTTPAEADLISDRATLDALLGDNQILEVPCIGDSSQRPQRPFPISFVQPTAGYFSVLTL